MKKNSMPFPRWFQKHPRLTLAVTVVLASLALLSGFEAVLYLFLRFPVLNNYFPYFKPTAVAVYFSHDRNILQFSPACAQYDSELTYILKPGECEFCNREYCNRFFINRVGLRDDAASLYQPEIIVLGDSYALGWGVEQEETFAQIIEMKTGMKVLNAGVSSYGTAREMLLLKRLDTSRLKYLVIQYSENDFRENQDFTAKGNRLVNMLREEYEMECYRQTNRVRYVPLMFTSCFLQQVKSFFQRKFSAGGAGDEKALSSVVYAHEIEAPKGQSSADTDSLACELFLRILSRQQFQHIKVIVLNISHHSLDTRSFIQQLAVLKKWDGYPAFIREMRLIDASSFLEKNDYYILDDHLNAAGHRKVADAVIQIIQSPDGKKDE